MLISLLVISFSSFLIFSCCIHLCFASLFTVTTFCCYNVRYSCLSLMKRKTFLPHLSPDLGVLGSQCTQIGEQGIIIALFALSLSSIDTCSSCALTVKSEDYNCFGRITVTLLCSCKQGFMIQLKMCIFGIGLQ